MLHDATVVGLDVRQLAGKYGLRHDEVRAILRGARHDRERLVQSTGPPRPPAYQPPSRRMPELCGVQPQTTAMIVDP
jgi:hypothetical protein